MYLSYRLPEENAENSKSLVQYPVRHSQSHNINATSLTKTQRMTHTISTVQQDCLNLKIEATQPFEASGTTSHPTRTEQPATPLTTLNHKTLNIAVTLNFPIQSSSSC